MSGSWVDKLFEVDKEDKVVTVMATNGVALRKFKRYRCLHSNRETLETFHQEMAAMLKRRLKHVDGPLTKQHYEEFYEVFGVYPKKFKQVFNAIMRGLWVTPVETYVQRYAFGKIPKRLDSKDKTRLSYSTQSIGVVPRLVEFVWERRELLEQLDKDGLQNVQPFVFHSGKTPAELKAIMGKGLWKRVCKQSYTRNRACARMIGPALGNSRVDTHLKRLEIMLQLPSKYLVRGGNNPLGCDEAALIYVGLEKSGQVPSLTQTRFGTRSPHMNVIDDTIRMAGQLGVNYNPKWSYAKWEEKHEEFTERVELGRFSKDIFDWVDEPWVVKQWEEVDVMTGTRLVFELLDNAYAIRKEGLDMHHCVSSYAQRSSTGKYMVYSVYRDGEKYSTLGLTVGDRVSRQQHYMACNKRVDELANSLADRMVNQINKLKTEEKVYD